MVRRSAAVVVFAGIGTGCPGEVPQLPEGTATEADSSTGDASSDGEPASTGPAPEASSSSSGPVAESTGEIDPCRDVACDPDASCTIVDDAPVCVCAEGFEGDGRTCALAPMLPVLRIESPCTGGGCTAATCASDNEQLDSLVFEAEPGVVYDVTLRVRGVVQLVPYAGGTTTGYYNEGGVPQTMLIATVELEISDPPRTAWLNAGSTELQSCELVDFEHTLPVAAGATITLHRLDGNGCQALNVDGTGTPIVIEGIPPAPEAFDGQFVQVDGVSAIAQ